jgi:membrane fusion protein, adhesin transport system
VRRRGKDYKMSQLSFKKLSRDMAGHEGLKGSAILFSVFALLIVFFVWAAWAKLDNVTRGQGKVVSSLQNQVVQSADSGVIIRRNVSENSTVKEGDVLFEIDAVDASTELSRLNRRLLVLNLKEQRLRAEIEGADFKISDITTDNAGHIALTELSLFKARHAELVGQLAVLEQRLLQRKQSIGAAINAKATAEKTAALLQDEIEIVSPLVAENISPATRLLELQRQLEQTRGEMDRQSAVLEQSASGILEVEAEIENVKANYMLHALEDLTAVVAEQSDLLASRPRLEQRVERALIRAPMDGIVNQLNYRTTGGVVKPGDVMLELVPTGDSLMVQAKIMPQDISQIRLGDAVKIRLTAYESARYGALSGRVTRISPDAIADPSNRGASFYLVDVEIEGRIMLENGEVVTLIPGMTASIDVLSGKRSVLNYLWQPIARIQELALRD